MKNIQKKAGIITLYGLYNHGNRLQNLAIQKLLEDNGIECETIVCRKSRIKEIVRTGIHFVKSKTGTPESIRYMNFYNFTKKYTHLRFLYEKTGHIPFSISKEYNYFLVGSDQVWNPEIRQNERDNFFLRFAKRDQRICISPSIAVNEIEPKYRREYIQGLNGFRYLSSREEVGAKIINDIVGRTAEVLVDPTMVLTKAEWHEYCSPLKVPEEKYVLQLFLEPLSKERKLKIQKMADQLGATVLDITDPKSAGEYYSVAPDGFIQLIENAVLVCTDSFHAAAFSINLNTPFYVFKRESSLESSNRMYSRLETILSKFKLMDRTEENYDIKGMMKCNFEQTNEILKVERKKFKEYLNRCLNQQKKPNILNLDEKQCTGCGACSLSCPKECIHMIQDAEGFYAPMVDETKCIDCGKCAKICPVMTKHRAEKHSVKAFAAYSQTQSVVNSSSSGGVFYHLAAYIIEQGGVVFGASFDKEQVVRHICVENRHDIKRLQGSKYVQSDIGESYSLVEEKLRKGRYVLFVGTPCQVAALKRYLNKDYEKLYTCDFVCHGVPSPEVWNDFLNENVEGNISGVNMRDKSNGWNNYSTKIIFEDREPWIRSRKASAYNKAFECNLSIRWSCFDCNFKGVSRISDITLADFWGIERFYPQLSNQEGTSLLIVQSEKGEQLLNFVNGDVKMEAIDLNTYVGKANTAMIKSPTINPYRSELMHHLDQPISGWLDETAEKCKTQSNSLTNRVKRKINRMIRIDS